MTIVASLTIVRMFDFCLSKGSWFFAVLIGRLDYKVSKASNI